MRVRIPLLIVAAGCTAAPPSPPPQAVPDARAEAVAAFATVQRVLQHAGCQNCHVSGDAPLQFDAGLPHQMKVVRGPDGHGAPGLPCLRRDELTFWPAQQLLL